MMTAANPLVKKEAKKIVDRFVRRFDKSYRLLVYATSISTGTSTLGGTS